MQKTKPRHLLSLKDRNGPWMKGIIELGMDIKKSMRDPATGDVDSAKYLLSPYRNALAGKQLVAIFEKSSLRTRLSFQTGMNLLGGHFCEPPFSKTHFDTSDVIAEIKSTARFASLIMIRPLKHSTAALFAKHSDRPVINGLSESDHPCQALADIMTILEALGKLEGAKVVYLGIANNVSNSLMLACVKTGAYFTLCVPEKGRDDLDPAALRQAEKTGLFRWEPDVARAVKGADILYTDTWVNMEHLEDEGKMEERKQFLMPYQLNKKVLELAGPQAWVMHDLPAHTGFEIDEYALHGPRSIAFIQAENRKWAQMAIMMNLMGETK
jgi:ornithine carbamoyltransferase